MASLSEFDREQAILVDLDEHGRVEVSELSRRFGVSAVTVRKDLESLERRSMLRRIRGGRADVRVALYMATLTATRAASRPNTLQAYYRALRARGKAPKVALIATMRKLLTILNAILHQQRPWRPLDPVSA